MSESPKNNNPRQDKLKEIIKKLHDGAEVKKEFSKLIKNVSPGVIGRTVQNCHPPKSMHVVNKIIESFKKKEKNSAEFWINKQGRLLYITKQGIIEVFELPGLAIGYKSMRKKARQIYKKE